MWPRWSLDPTRRGRTFLNHLKVWEGLLYTPGPGPLDVAGKDFLRDDGVLPHLEIEHAHAAKVRAAFEGEFETFLDRDSTGSQDLERDPRLLEGGHELPGLLGIAAEHIVAELIVVVAARANHVKGLAVFLGCGGPIVVRMERLDPKIRLKTSLDAGLDGLQIMGADSTGHLEFLDVFQHLAKKGARSVMVSNRSYDRAQSLAAEFGGRAVRFDECLQAMGEADIVVTSTGCPHTILHREELSMVMRTRRNRPLFLIDIAVPRDIDSDVQELANVYLYNVDHLETIVRENMRLREQELARCREIIARE